MRQCLRQQPVGKPGVPGEERPMQVGPDRASYATPFIAAFAIVSEPGDDATERRHARVEMRAAGMVLKARETRPHAWLELALEEYVADHPFLARDRLQRKEADPGQLDTSEVSIRTAEELVAAAHREYGRTVFGR